ncbi:MAG: hypothetical protein D8M59_04350 [Planctomycetes bacterium]|nr:hypothetical protein [Planctomycetota bacterium]
MIGAGFAFPSAVSAQVEAPAHIDFSIEKGSPSDGRNGGDGTGARLTPDAILRASDPIGPMPRPYVHVDGPQLQLGLAGDELDGLSINRAQFTYFYIFFSVDEEAVGNTAPFDPEGFIWPYNLQHQASRNQQAADVYVSTEIYDAFARTRVGGLGVYNNPLVFNQATIFEQNVNLVPPQIPYWTSHADRIDNLDAMTDIGRGTLGTQFAPWYYFSVSSASPSLPLLTGSNNSGADVFAWDGSTETSQIYTAYSELGLDVDDDIDALVVGDTLDEFDETGTWEQDDWVLFSLAPGSPSLAAIGASPGDVFLRVYGDADSLGLGYRIASTDDLGLVDTDNVDALDVVGSGCASGDTVCIATQLSQAVLFGSLNLTVPTQYEATPSTVAVVNAPPGRRVWFFVSQGLAPFYIKALNSTLALDSTSLTFFGSAVANPSGYASRILPLPPGPAYTKLWFQATLKKHPSEVVYRVVQP